MRPTGLFWFDKQKRYNQTVKSRGYTVLELLIVLAISGLIMVIVFLAVAQGNRDQRDDARKADAGRYLNAVVQWTSDHSGVPPGSADITSVTSTYVTAGSSTFADPQKGAWVPTWSTGAPAAVSTSMYVQSQSACDATGIVAGGPRQFAVAVRLEGGIYCVSK